MNKKRNIIIGLIVCVLLMTVVFFVFNHGKSNEQVVTEYFELLKKKDYKQMYQMLNSKTVYTQALIPMIHFFLSFISTVLLQNMRNLHLLKRLFQ